MKELLLKGAEQMGVAMTAEQAQAFCEYHRMLVSANKTMNLTRISDDPAEAVDATKRRRLSKTALHYIAREHLMGAPARFDVASVFLDGRGRVARIELLENAFDFTE